MDERDARIGERGRDRRLDLGVVGDPQATRATCLGKRGAVDAPEIGGGDPAWVRPLLVHADRAVHGVVEDEDGQPEPLSDGRLQFGHQHREAAVTREGDHGPCRRALVPRRDRRADRGRQPIAHGA